MDQLAVLFIHALSPLHAGTGQGVGSIDLPIARERATGIPYLPGSSLKGVLRDQARRAWSKEEVWAVFGPETDNAHEHAGALQVGDAKLLLLPVRSVYGVFAYATSPYLLDRFRREAQLAGLTPPELPTLPSGEEARLTPGSRLAHKEKVYLEDLDLKAQEDPMVGKWEGWLRERTQAPLKGRLALLSDDIMNFLLETATEVVARVRLEDETKTVAQGALWYEENLPAESLLYTLVRAEATHRKTSDLTADQVLEKLGQLVERPLQLGGKATVGRGLAALRLGR